MARWLPAVALFVVVAAGCGSAAQSRSSARHGVPHALARQWEARASAIAAAASAGDDCHARQLASSLRDQVVARQQQLPLRLRSPLVDSVKTLASRISCTPPPPPVATKPPKGPKPPHDDHGHHGHKGHHGHDGGDGNDQ